MVNSAQDSMDWIRDLDRSSIPLRRMLSNAIAPLQSKPAHPLFSERIKERKRRWLIERQPNSYAAVASKTDGQAYMRSLGYAVPEVYGVYRTLDEIPSFSDLPPSFVLKPVEGWSAVGVFLMHKGADRMRNRTFTREELIHEVLSLSGPAAKQAKEGPWVAEELLFEHGGRDQPAMDYKFFCFGPKLAMMQINRRTGRAVPFYWHWFRDADWQPIPRRVGWEKFPERSDLPRPPCMDEMLRIVEDVGRRLNIFVRIDMYATDRGPVFGEFTGYPHNGEGYTPWGDAWLGSLWKTPDGGFQA